MDVKVFKTFISLIITVLIFTSCASNSYESILFNKSIEDYGNTGGLTLPFDVNNTEIKIMLISDKEELSDSLVVKELSKRTGLNINITNVSTSDASRYTQLLLSTNTLPDIIKTTLDTSEVNSLGEKGIFVSVNKYLAELPNFRRIFIENDTYSSVMDDYTANDNNLYFYPKFDYQKEVTKGFLYRKDIFDKHGLKMWQGKDEFYATLKTLKTLYPDSTPYISESGINILDEWSLSFGIDFPGMFYDFDKEKWIYSGCDARFFEMLQFIKKLYDESLFHKSFLSSNQILWDWKITGKNSFVTYGDLSNMEILNGKGKSNNPDFNLSFASPPGDIFKIKKSDIIGMGPSVTNNKNSLLSLKLLDYLSSPSGIELSTLGVLNKTYEYKMGSVVYNDFSENDYIVGKELEEKYGLFIDGLTRSVDKRSPYLHYSKKEQAVLNLINEKDGFVEEYPKLKLKNEDRQKAKEIITILNNKAYEFARNYILKTDDKNFNEWTQEAYKSGLEELEEIYNKER